MARKPPDWHQPSLFPPDPAKTTEPEDQSHSKPEGDQHAVQDNYPRTSATTTTWRDARPANFRKGPEASLDNGTLRSRELEDQPRNLRRKRSARRGCGAATRARSRARARWKWLSLRNWRIVLPTTRVRSQRQRTAFPRPQQWRSSAITRRLRLQKASRNQPTLVFDPVLRTIHLPPLQPRLVRPLSDGTVLSSFRRAAVQAETRDFPLKVSPQVSAWHGRPTRAEPRLGAESLVLTREAPTAGPLTPEEGDRAMMGTQLSLQFDAPPPFISVREPEPTRQPKPLPIASGEKSKARDIITAIRTLKAIEQQQRSATPDEKQLLSRFSGFGPVALSLFPDPVSGKYKDAGWQSLGDELKTLLSPEEYDSARAGRPSTPSTHRRPSSLPCTATR